MVIQFPEDSEVDGFFTNSEHAIQLFTALKGGINPNKRILTICGIGGVGKSTLLKKFRLICSNDNVPVALISSEDVGSGSDILKAWNKDLEKFKIKFPDFSKVLNALYKLQNKVKEKAQRSDFGRKVSASAATRTVEVVATASLGPVGGIIAGIGMDAFTEWLPSVLPNQEDREFLLDPVEQLTEAFLKDLKKAVISLKIVLMLDTYEKMTTLDSWVCKLAQRLPDKVFLVIAGRESVEWERMWQGWQGRAEAIELNELTADHARKMVRRWYRHIGGVGEPDPDQVEAVVLFSRGLPMAASTVVRLWAKYQMTDFQTVRPKVVQDVVDRLLEGVPREMRATFEAAAILRYFDVTALRALLQEDGNTNTLYEELTRWPFIRPRREGLAVHDTVRELINEGLRIRNNARYRELHERAMQYYEQKLIHLY